METDPATAIDAIAASSTFEAFFADNSQSVARALALTLGDGELAADATNEAMTRAYQRWSKISRYDNPAAWVYRVGLNWSLSWKRRRRRERERPVQLSAAHAENTLRDDSLDAALADLSVEHRAVDVLTYAYVEGGVEPGRCLTVVVATGSGSPQRVNGGSCQSGSAADTATAFDADPRDTRDASVRRANISNFDRGILLYGAPEDAAWIIVRTADGSLVSTSSTE